MTLIPMVVALVAAGQAAPASLDAPEAAAIVRSIEQERARAMESLRSDPTSYLATIDRRDFGERQMLTVGRAADNDVRLEDAAVKAHHLRVVVQGERFLVEAVDPGAEFLVNAKPARQATVGPSAIEVGRFVLRLSHQHYPAIIVFDPQSPRLREYKGLDYFPVDLLYRYELPLTANPAPEEVVIMSTRGHRRRAERVGWFDFLVGTTPCRLEATRLLEPGVDEHAVSVFFRDATSGRDTYPLGRYVDARKLPDGRYLLDFNAAYNPACAFSEHYNCPIPPKANTLTVAIRAGEKDPHYHASR